MSDLQDPRVLFAAERTLLAWNRTSLGLIAFGFVVERAGLLMQVLQSNGNALVTLSPAFILGLLFILFGGVCAMVSAWQFSRVINSLNENEIPPGYRPRWGMLVNVVVAILGLSLAAVLLHLHQ